MCKIAHFEVLLVWSCECVTVFNNDNGSTSVPGTHKFMKLQFDSLEPKFAHFANGKGRRLKASLLLHQHKRKIYKLFVSKPSILHLFLMVMVFPPILWHYADRLSTGKLQWGHRMRPMEGYTLYLLQSVTLSSPSSFPTSPPAIIFTHITGVITTNADSLATSSLGWFKHAR